MKRLSLFRFDSNCKTIKFKIQKKVVQLSLNGSIEEIWPFRRCSGSEHEENANEVHTLYNKKLPVRKTDERQVM